MPLKIFLLLSFIFENIKGIEEEISEPFSELNDFITVNKNIKFNIRAKYDSIAYFDSIDKNCLVYTNNERIDGEFYKISPIKDYTILVKLYNPGAACILKRYFSNVPQSIYLKGNSTNFLYFKSHTYYTMYFQENTVDRIFTLSPKTSNTNLKVTIGSCKLNNINSFCKIRKDMKDTKYFISEGGDAFLEIINVVTDDNYEILDQQNYNNYELNSKISILNIPYTQKIIKIQIESSQQFKFSFSNGYIYDKNIYYYSNCNNNVDSTKNNDKYVNSIIFYDIYRNVSLMENELFSFVINIEKNENQIVYLNYEQLSEIDELMDEILEDSYCENIIKNLKDIFEIYVFSDIAKNPPEIEGIDNYHHEKIDFQKRLSAVSTKNRKFYEFYQEIELIMATVRDGHLGIIAKETPFLTKISQYYVTLPFSYKIINSKIYIDVNTYYYSYNKNVQKIIMNNYFTPIKKINRRDPFDYIQNWSKFRNSKNIHSQFTKRFTHISGFYLNYYPLNYSDFSLNEYTFENGDILRIPYLILKPMKENFEFDNYFLNILKNTPPSNEIPPLDKINDNFLFFQNKKKILNEESTTTINWDLELSHIEGNDAFKCRIDEINKVNVIYQNSFNFKFHLEAIGKILKCVKAFLNNKYPIFIIESKNGGGHLNILEVLLQIIQPRVENRNYLSLRVTPVSKEFFKTYNFYRNINYKDCSEINYFSDFKLYYNEDYDSSSINHKRTPTYDGLSLIYRLALREFRKEVINNKNLKRPTDVIVFTDSYSFSATSLFIKSLQNSGGAVIVGYFGNPKIKGTSLFDASQSPSVVDNLAGTRMKKELEKKGFILNGVTVEESFSYYPDNTKNLIPMEYNLDPVDFRVDIYSFYSDDIYDKFIEEGLKIHKKLNEENQCNSKNSKLLLHDDKCKNNGASSWSGGYKCGSGNTWDKSRCYGYYCEIGYYFDRRQNKCIENCKFPNEKSFFVYEDNYNKIFDIPNNTRYNFIFLFYGKKNYFYTKDYNNKRIPVTSNFEIFFERPFEYKLKIEEVYTNLKLINMNDVKTRISSLKSRESLIFMENSEDYILYLDNMYNSSKTKYKIAEYNTQMRYEEMFKQDSKYFSDYKESIHFFSKYKLYLLYINVVELDPFNLFIGPLITKETIEIKGYETNFLFLEKNKIYLLDFRKNEINRMLKLSRETIKSVVTIINKSFVLNSKNLYYELDDNYKGKLILKIENADALIEFLFRQKDEEIDVLRFNKRKFVLNKRYNIMAIPRSYKSKLINIELNRNEILTEFSIYFGYSIPPFNYFATVIKENLIKVENRFIFTINEHYKGNNIDLMEDEYYCLMIENLGKDVLMIVDVKDDGGNLKKDLTTNDNSKYMKFEKWIISLLLFLW